MAHRQTYREGPPTPGEYDDIFDSDPAEWTPYYNKRYEAHLYQTEQEKAREIFRFLRALNEHLDEQDRKRARHRQSRHRDTGNETTIQQNEPTIPPLSIEIGQPRGTHKTVGEPLLSRQRPSTTEDGQPVTNEPTPSETTSETSHGLRKQNPLTHRNIHSELIPMQKNNNQEHTTPTGEPKADRATAPRQANPIDDQQTEISVRTTQAIDIDPGGETITTLIAEPAKPPGPPRAKNPTLEKDKKYYEHTSRGLTIRINKHSSTPPNPSTSSSEGSYETYPHWQPMNTNTSNPRTKPITTNTIDKSSPTPNPEEPFTGRDTKVIPDRGKSFRRS